LKYELALGYEALGNFKNAFDLFSDIFQEDHDFREVAAKVKLLSAPKAQLEKAEGVPAAEQKPVDVQKAAVDQKPAVEEKPAVEQKPEPPEAQAPVDGKSPPTCKPPKRVHYI
jgi:hypothetical protein